MGNFYEEAMMAIKKAVNEQFGGNVASASRAWNIPNDNLNKWLRRDRVPNLDNISPILEKICTYTFDSVPTIKRPGPYAPVEKVEGEDLPVIPVMGSTGAGDAVEIFSQTPDYLLPVPERYYRVDMIGLVVDGVSMEPTIQRGAIVGIMPYDGSITEGGIYLIQRPPFGRTIKRIRMGPAGEILLVSDNPDIGPVTLVPEGYEEIIKGRVVWIWQIC